MKWTILGIILVSTLADVLTTIYLIDSTGGVEGELNPVITGIEGLIISNVVGSIIISAFLLYLFPDLECRARVRKMTFGKILKQLISISTPMKAYFQEGEPKDILIFFIIVMLLAGGGITRFLVAVSNIFVIFTGYGYADILLATTNLFSISVTRIALYLASLVSLLTLSAIVSFIGLKNTI